MSVEKILLKDSRGKKSVTMTAFVIGNIIVNLKLALSGIVVMGFTFEKFTGMDYSVALGALGAVYVLRRSTEKEVKEEVKNG